jgi:hypothetical protein
MRAVAWSVKALAEYRKGNFESAADWAQRTLAHHEMAAWVRIQTSATLAMARHQLKQPALAQAALTTAEDNVDERLRSSDRGGHVGAEWVNMLVSHAVLREAKALLEGHSEAGLKTMRP